MLHRIRLALQGIPSVKLGGPGRSRSGRNFHRRQGSQHAPGQAHGVGHLDAPALRDKTPVIGILERDGEVRAGVIPNRRKQQLCKAKLANTLPLEPLSILMRCIRTIGL